MTIKAQELSFSTISCLLQFIRLYNRNASRHVKRSPRDRSYYRFAKVTIGSQRSLQRFNLCPINSEVNTYSHAKLTQLTTVSTVRARLCLVRVECTVFARGQVKGLTNTGVHVGRFRQIPHHHSWEMIATRLSCYQY